MLLPLDTVECDAEGVIYQGFRDSFDLNLRCPVDSEQGGHVGGYRKSFVPDAGEMAPQGFTAWLPAQVGESQPSMRSIIRQQI